MLRLDGTLAAGLAGAALLHAAPAPAAISASARRWLGIRATVARPGSVALTFDDGPHPQGTPAVLEVLAAAGARATFFLVGEQVERRPGLAAEVVAAGHAVALHGHTHRSHLRLAPAQAADDMRRGGAALAEAVGRSPRLHRPPYGLYSAASLASARRQGLEPLLWSRHGRDWSARATARTISARLTVGLGAGEVVLLHDADHYGAPGSWRRTAAALPRLLEVLGETGLRAVPA